MPMPGHPFSEEITPKYKLNTKPTLAQLEVVSSHPNTYYLGDETNPHLTPTSFEEAVESNSLLNAGGWSSLAQQGVAHTFASNLPSAPATNAFSKVLL